MPSWGQNASYDTTQAQGGYQSLFTQGQQDLGIYQQGFLPTLASLFGTLGLSSPINPLNLPTSGGPNAGSGNFGGPLGNGTGQQGQQGQGGSGTSKAGAGQTGQNPFLQLLQTGQTSSPLLQNFMQTAGVGDANAYGLTPAQQTELNTQVDAINRSQQSAIASYRQQMETQGIDDPRALQAGEQYIQQQYGAQASQLQATFAENARSNRQNALASLLTAGQGAFTQQQGLLEGLVNLFSGVGSKGSQEVGTAASGYGTLAGAAQNQANIQQAQVMSALSSLGQILGLGLGGGFGGAGGGGGTPPITDMSQILG